MRVIDITTVASPTDCAWAAGIIDGEGHIGVFTYKTTISLKIVVQMTSPLVPTRLHELFGGFLGGPYYRGQSTRKGVWHWSVSGNEMRRILPMICPYMVEKLAKVELAKEFVATRASMPTTWRSPEQNSLLRGFKERMRVV